MLHLGGVLYNINVVFIMFVPYFLSGPNAWCWNQPFGVVRLLMMTLIFKSPAQIKLCMKKSITNKYTVYAAIHLLSFLHVCMF